MNIQRCTAIAAFSLVGALALSACGERTDGQTVGQKVDSAISRSADAGREAKQDAQQAAATAGQATREATADARTSVMGAASKAGDKADDAQITARVKTGLSADKDLSATRIDVDTIDGVVTLNGTAPNAAAKTRAAEIAKNAKDVKSVDNKLTVQPG